MTIPVHVSVPDGVLDRGILVVAVVPTLNKVRLMAIAIRIVSAIVDDAIAIIHPIAEKVRATGKLEVDQIEAAVVPLVSSVLRNKDAVAALLRIRNLDDYTVFTLHLQRSLGRRTGTPPRLQATPD